LIFLSLYDRLLTEKSTNFNISVNMHTSDVLFSFESQKNMPQDTIFESYAKLYEKVQKLT